MLAQAATIHGNAFTTDGVPSSRRPSVFRKGMANTFAIGLNVRAIGSRPLECAVSGFARPGLRLASLRFSPHITEPASSQPAGKPSFLISVHREGQAYISQAGREGAVCPGDMFLVDPSRPFTIETGDIRTTSIYVAAAPLRSLVPNIDSFTGIPISTTAGPASLFRAYVDELFRIGLQLDTVSAERVADTVPTILATALLSIDAPCTQVGASPQGAHRQRVLRFIRENLADPNLSPSLIARSVGISLRYLYDLFEGEPEALMRRVWRERLERCRAEIVHPGMADVAIGEIAFRWGFNDSAHFSRSFRRQFAMSPREARLASSALAT